MMPEQKQVDTQAKAWDVVLDEDKGPAAIVIREHLRPAAGLRSPVAPPTFAGRGQGDSGYNYDGEDPGNWENVLKAAAEGRVSNRCTLDSIPSQANRMESALKRFEGRYIPKVTLTGSKRGEMSLLDVGHRVADAALWAADGYEDFQAALEAYVQGNALPLARVAPTSLVFGYWDSRGTTGGKARRLIRGEIFAENVVKLSRRSQYWASVDPEASEDLRKALDEARAKAKGDKEKDVGSQLGFRDAPASGLGGVIAHGDIVRLTILSLSGLRNLTAPAETLAADDGNENENENENKNKNGGVDDTTKLRRYLFALMLASASTPRGGWDLREGCLLVQQRRKAKDGDKDVEVPDMEVKIVFHDGREEDWGPPSAPEVEAYLKATTNDLFGGEFPQPRTPTFNAMAAAERVREKLQEKERPTGAQASVEGSQSKRRGQRAPRNS
jgi:CRISPR-associated protein Csb1